MTYKIVIDEQTQNEVIVKTNEDGSISWIPKSESNSDYQAYLRWLNGEDESGTL